MRQRIGYLGTAGLVVALAVPAGAGEFNPLGDGSGANNIDLLRDATTGCENCAPVPPREWGVPPFEIDWRLALRGAVIEGSSGTRFEAIALPSFSLTHQHLRGSFSVGADAEIDYRLDGNVRVGSLGITASTDYRIDALTTTTLKGSFGLSQGDPDAPGMPVNVKVAPLVTSGQGAATLTRDFGPWLVDLRGDVTRTAHSDTVYDDDTTSSNAFQNLTSVGGGGRLGLRLGPILTGFVDGEAEYELYDEPSPSLLVRLDNLTLSGRSGLTARFGEVLKLEGSLGLGYRAFADAGLSDLATVLYDASAVYRPDETMALSATFTTALSSPGTTSGARAKVTYAASAEASYRVNPWLSLRGSASWSEVHYWGIDTDEYGWGLGAGADYQLGEHTALTADYAFSRSTTTPDPAEDQHRVTLGVSFSR